jgi:hypothetical protein
MSTAIWTGRRAWVCHVPPELNSGASHPGGFGTIVGLASSLGIAWRARVAMEDGVTLSVPTKDLVPTADPSTNPVMPERRP